MGFTGRWSRVILSVSLKDWVCVLVLVSGCDALFSPSSKQTGSRKDLLAFVSECQDRESGGLRPAPGHDPHLLYTLSGIQIIGMLDADPEQVIDAEKVVAYIASLQQPDGSFAGDKWGEVDVRFSFLALASLALLKRLQAVNTDTAVDFILKCQNPMDRGFGSRPGCESHAGLVYCAVASLSLLGRLKDMQDMDSLSWWLSERQLPSSGGLNGRPEKLPDLCYGWWVLSSLQILGRLQSVHAPKLVNFTLLCQDRETGGFADRPSNISDPFHTCFALTALSLLTHDLPHDPTHESLVQLLEPVNPVFCMPQSVIERMGIKVQLL